MKHTWNAPVLLYPRSGAWQTYWPQLITIRAKFNPDGVIRVIFDWKNMEKASATEQWRV